MIGVQQSGWRIRLGESVKSHYHKLGREGRMSELTVRTSNRLVSEQGVYRKHKNLPYIGRKWEAGRAVHACNPNTWETEFEVSLSKGVKPCLKTISKKEVHRPGGSRLKAVKFL